MDTYKSLLALTVTILFTLGTPVSKNTVEPNVALHTMTNLTVGQEEMVNHSLTLFDDAGLRLPGIDFVGHTDNTACNGKDGIAIRHPQRTEVRLCSEETNLWQKRILIHEMAHAWDHHTLHQDERDELMATRSTIDGWRDGEWHERGAEHTAEIITWGIIDQPLNITTIEENSCQELRAGYLTLTGSHPTQGHTSCS
ncbi:MAG: hypothetical protein QNJ77_13985 [Acidimicrobiia bacterium]|nr:hypothetical protein [Acidimicrobiia bacterium]